MRSHSITTLICLLAPVGCAAPGTPLMRTSENDGEGQLIQGCNNVSSKARVENYIKDFYLTTWGSSSMEGYMEGLETGLDDARGTKAGLLLRQIADSAGGRRVAAARTQASPESFWPEKTNSLPASPKPFCRRYAASQAAASRAIALTIANLEHRPLFQDKRNGVFETEFIERSHRSSRWRDRYVIFADWDGPNQTIIRIYRIVYIDRSGDVFNQATSVGHNEAWIMTRIEDLLRR